MKSLLQKQKKRKSLPQKQIKSQRQKQNLQLISEMRNNQIKILDGEIEQLILTKNEYIRENNDLATSIQEQKVEIHNLEIQSANIVSNEVARLQEINKDFLKDMEAQNKTLLTKEECLFVLLSHLSVNINKNGSLSSVIEENV